VRGINVVGLERAGLGEPVLSVLRRTFRVMYRSGLNLSQALARIEGELLPAVGPDSGRGQLQALLEFVRSSRRGVELRSGPETETVSTEEAE
jgi:UDP-N-acetylglucosamine acyltransferase